MTISLTQWQIISCIAVVVMLISVWFVRVVWRYNTTDWGSRSLNFLDGLNRLFCTRYHRLRYQVLPLPETGSAIVASNHVSGLDPLLLIAASPRPLRFLIAREQFERYGLQWLFRAGKCIPVEREHRPERAMREALRALASGEVVALFPHGGIHLDSDPPRKIKAGVVRLSLKSHSTIFPARLTGVAGQGHVIAAVLKRGHARLENLPAIHAHTHGPDHTHQTLERLAACLEGRVVSHPESVTQEVDNNSLNKAC